MTLKKHSIVAKITQDTMGDLIDSTYTPTLIAGNNITLTQIDTPSGPSITITSLSGLTGPTGPTGVGLVGPTGKTGPIGGDIIRIAGVEGGSLDFRN